MDIAAYRSRVCPLPGKALEVVARRGEKATLSLSLGCNLQKELPFLEGSLLITLFAG